MPTADSKRKRAAKTKSETKASGAPSASLDPSLLRRVVVETVRPQVDGGRFPVKRTAGEAVTVTADIHADGHDMLAAVLLYRRGGDAAGAELAAQGGRRDRWGG